MRQLRKNPIPLPLLKNTMPYIVLSATLQWYKAFGWKQSLKDIYEKEKGKSIALVAFHAYKASFA